MKRNKKADISITILVIAIVVLCSIAFLSFYLYEKNQTEGKLDSISFLQEVYNLAESVKYSGNINNYKNVKFENGNFIIEKTFSIKKGLIKRTEVEVLKVNYTFFP